LRTIGRVLRERELTGSGIREESFNRLAILGMRGIDTFFDFGFIGLKVMEGSIKFGSIMNGAIVTGIFQVRTFTVAVKEFLTESEDNGIIDKVATIGKFFRRGFDDFLNNGRVNIEDLRESTIEDGTSIFTELNGRSIEISFGDDIGQFHVLFKMFLLLLLDEGLSGDMFIMETFPETSGLLRGEGILESGFLKSLTLIIGESGKVREVIIARMLRAVKDDLFEDRSDGGEEFLLLFGRHFLELLSKEMFGM
jgi:hypothetical protein